MYDALDVARYIVNYANDNDIAVSALKLQRILYFVQLQFLCSFNKPCFADEIEAWATGSVVVSVNKEFKRWGSLSIPRVNEYYDISDGIWNLKKVPYQTKMTVEDCAVVNSVINKCNEYSNTSLGYIVCHQTPWIRAYTRYGKSKNIITVSSMTDFIRDCCREG